MAELRTVRALEDDLSDEGVNVLLIDIHTDTGTTLRQRYRTNVTPTFVVLNEQGEELWRGHDAPSESEVLDFTRS